MDFGGKFELDSNISDDHELGTSAKKQESERYMEAEVLSEILNDKENSSVNQSLRESKTSLRESHMRPVPEKTFGADIHDEVFKTKLEACMNSFKIDALQHF